MKSNRNFLLTIMLFGLGTAACQAQEEAVGSPVPIAPIPPEPAVAPEPAELPVAANIAYGGAYGGGFSGDFSPFSPGAPSRPLVVLKDGAAAKDLPEVEEDLNVMSRILDKAASGREGRSHNAMGILIHSGGPGSSVAPRNLYLEGYGAVFFLGVNYPLLAPANKNPQDENKEHAKSEWEETRRELEEPPGQAFSFTVPPAVSFGGAPAEEYEADKVEKLKSDLTAALKNAAHMRRVKSEEAITVVVTGRGSGAETKTLSRRTGGQRHAVAVFSRNSVEASGARLILRTKKADAEAFQKGQISLDEFRKRVSTTLQGLLF